MAFFGGLDLGCQQDYSAFVVLEQERSPDNPELWTYNLRLLERFPLGTKYAAIVDRLRDLLGAETLGSSSPPLRGMQLAVDQTGVGLPVVQQIHNAGLPAVIRPILITAGHQVTYENGAWHTPKKELVSTLQVLLQTQRLKIAKIPERELLIKELLAFRVKVSTAGTESFEAWRERDHDDMVLATAMAVWLAERGQRHAFMFVVNHSGREDWEPRRPPSRFGWQGR
jgi:hypothetical protein